MNILDKPLSEREIKVAVIEAREKGVREYASQTSSGHAHIDIGALLCVQGTGRFVHAAFHEPLIVEAVDHGETSENGPSQSKTKHFIH